MGEIGISRHEYLYDLRFWEIVLISRGHARRHRDAWSMTRWQTYYIMLAQTGSDNLKKSGINSPTDLIKFPWDNMDYYNNDAPSEKEIEELRRQMREENEKLKSQ